jgi:transcriptional regulator GlxA family with amidase domain
MAVTYASEPDRISAGLDRNMPIPPKSDMPKANQQHAPKIAILALPQSTPAALYGLYEVFASVGHTWEELTGEPSDARRLSPRIVAKTTDPIASPLGFTITPNGVLDDSDVVIVADISIPDPADLPSAWEAELEWLRERYAAGSIICSVCTGTTVLAEAGLLDGLEATTHWSTIDFIKHRYPGIRLVPQKILAPTGPGDQIVTGGGATAWEDMALYLVARLTSGAEAVRIAKIFLLGDHSEGQLPFAGARKARRHEDGVVAQVQTWIAENYHLSNPVARMVERSGLTERTFIRRFRTATGYTPMEYVQTLRIEEAKHLLETTGTTIEMIAVEVGYEDPNFFRRLFKRRVGITPARYRQRFSAILKR